MAGYAPASNSRRGGVVHGDMKPRRNRLVSVTVVLVVALGVGSSFTACSPTYVIKAGIAQAKILAARRPLPEGGSVPATEERTRGLLTLAM